MWPKQLLDSRISQCYEGIDVQTPMVFTKLPSTMAYFRTVQGKIANWYWRAQHNLYHIVNRPYTREYPITE